MTEQLEGNQIAVSVSVTMTTPWQSYIPCDFSAVYCLRSELNLNLVFFSAAVHWEKCLLHPTLKVAFFSPLLHGRFLMDKILLSFLQKVSIYIYIFKCWLTEASALHSGLCELTRSIQIISEEMKTSVQDHENASALPGSLVSVQFLKAVAPLAVVTSMMPRYIFISLYIIF
uniref:Uncharacterized protein n=1 Tax=Molossus molossus TaxID=27622 RepID=A0A7J8I0W0_MOLMO|nr:hypothetical protein HJG59_010797 [Molossus molossus]